MVKLRDYQSKAAELVIKYLTNNKEKHPLIAAPTGSGKSLILSKIIEDAIAKWPKVQVLVLSHVREIIEQDAAAIKALTSYDVGVYSAGLGKKEIKRITVAGIQSVYSKPDQFSQHRLIIIDECHLIPTNNNSMYQKFFAGLNKPRYLGLTATPFRLGVGYIYGDDDETLFDDVVYDLTSREKFNQLIKDGYLCNLKTAATDIELDVDGIKTVAGDFDKKGLSTAVNVKSITKKAVAEIVARGKGYKKWLIFAIDISHAENIALEFDKHGVSAMFVHSKMEMDSKAVIEAHKNGAITALININMLTTGYDDPEIDLIALLRPTKSPVIHVQTIGRGLRIAPNKDHCLILDFAGNTERLGPINDITVKKPGKGKKGGEPITKRCPECDTIHHPTKKVCEFCGHVFKFKTLLSGRAGGHDVIVGKTKVWLKVSEVDYTLHQKKNSPNMVKVTYQCGLRTYNEYVCVEHKGFAGHKARHWLSYRGLPDCKTSLEAVHAKHKLSRPNRILIDKAGKYPIVKEYSF